MYPRKHGESIRRRVAQWTNCRSTEISLQVSFYGMKQLCDVYFFHLFLLGFGLGTS